MPVPILPDYSLLPHNALKLDLAAEYFAHCRSLADCRAALEFARARDLPVTLIGGGTNIVLTSDIKGLVLHCSLRGRRLALSGSSLRLTAAAGENWADLAADVSRSGWWGLERLALIPGLAGAAPVQNIGAYGAELGDVCESVSTLHLDTGEVRSLAAAACRFAYRDSLFRDADSRYLILGLQMKLDRRPRKLTHRRLLEELGGSYTHPAEVHDAVVRLRQRILPDPKATPNVGSFFKNPTVSPAKFADLGQSLQIEGFAAPAGVKVPAARLIDALGLKGASCGAAEVSRLHALVLQNSGNASPHDLLTLARRVQKSVRDRFGIHLEPEPVLPGEAAAQLKEGEGAAS